MITTVTSYTNFDEGTQARGAGIGLRTTMA